MEKKSNIISLVLLIIVLINIYPSNFLAKNSNVNVDYFDGNSLNRSSFDLEWEYVIHTGGVYQAVNDVDISSNGSYIVVGTGYSYIYLFHKSSNNPLWSYQEMFLDNYVRIVAISSDGEYIAGGYKSGNIYAFHRSSNVPLWIYKANGIILDLEMTSDGKYIVAGSIDNYIYVFNTTNTANPLLWKYNATNYVTDVAISKSSSYIVAGVSNNILLFNISNALLLNNYTTSGIVRDVDISSDGIYIAAGNEARKMLLFNSSSTIPILNYTCNQKVYNVKISSNGDYIAAITSTINNKIYFFNKSKLTPIWISTMTRWIPDSLSLSADGKYIAAGCQDYLHIYCPSNPNPLWSYRVLQGFTEAVPSCSAFSDDNKYVIFGAINDYVYLLANNPPSLSSDAGNPDTDGTFNLFWDSPIDANDYSIYVNDQFISEINESITLWADEIAELSYTLSYMIPDIYYFIVVANTANNSTISNCIQVVVEYPPFNFTLSSTAQNVDVNYYIDVDGNYDLTWDNSVGADNYSIYVHNTTITTINETVTELINGINELSYSISGLQSEDYFYIVVAYNEYGQTLSNCIKISVQIPPKPFLLYIDTDPIDIDGSFTLQWDNSLYADNYSVFMHDKFITEINDTVSLLAEGLEDLTYFVSGLSNGDYYYKVIAFNKFANISSNCLKISVRIPPGPFLLNATTDMIETDFWLDIDGVFNLTWDNSVGADNYSIYVYDCYITEIDDYLTILAEDLKQTAYTISGLSNGDYYYIIVAYNQSGSTLSNCIHVKVQIPSKKEITIPYGNFYFLVISFSIIGLILIYRRLIKISNINHI